MFNELTERLSKVINMIGKKARLTEENISVSTREVRKALLEADVALPVVKEFTSHVRTRALGREVRASLSPGQEFIKVVRDELELALGGEASELILNARPPVVILLAGLQGAGKTTTTVKLGNFLKNNKKKRVLMVSVDCYRPAAIKQLEILGNEAEISVFADHNEKLPIERANAALEFAQKTNFDVLLVDTAGRQTVNQEMMNEISLLNSTLVPSEVLFVVDSMTGQDAANTAAGFSKVLPLTGVVITKTDGDARGGAALSVKKITGKPIKFVGSGERIGDLDVFYPDRVASRILGMGDVLGLIDDVEKNIDKKIAEKTVRKLTSKKGGGFDLGDLLEQVQQMKRMGGVSAILDKLPGGAQMSAQADQINFGRIEAIINSMTALERTRPDVINGSRKQRIAKGSGTTIQQVGRVLKQHKQMSKQMKKIGKSGGIKNLMGGLSGMTSHPTRFR